MAYPGTRGRPGDRRDRAADRLAVGELDPGERHLQVAELDTVVDAVGGGGQIDVDVDARVRVEVGERKEALAVGGAEDGRPAAGAVPVRAGKLAACKPDDAAAGTHAPDVLRGRVAVEPERPTAVGQRQVPAMHVAPIAHALPQPPQFSGSDATSSSQPFAMLPSQSARPAV